MAEKKGYRIQVYTTDEEVYKDLMTVVKDTGLSLSEIAGASMIWGFYDLLREGVFRMPLFSSQKRRKTIARKVIQAK